MRTLQEARKFAIAAAGMHWRNRASVRAGLGCVRKQMCSWQREERWAGDPDRREAYKPRVRHLNSVKSPTSIVAHFWASLLVVH